MPEIESFALEFTRDASDIGGPGRFVIVPDFFESSAAAGARGAFTRAEVMQTLRDVRVMWEAYLDVGFDTFGVDDGGRHKYVVFFDESLRSSGNANDARIGIGLGALRGANRVAEPDERARLTAQHRSLIAHELFHAVHLAAPDPFEPMATFLEGVAESAKYLLLSADERRALGVPSYEAYLAAPGRTMWDRPSPGNDGDSRSTATLFWLYFVDQLGRRHESPGPKLDALVPMMRDTGWRFDTDLTPNDIDQHLAGAFLGNGDTQLIARSRASGTRFTVVSPSENFGGNGQVHLALAEGERFGGAWKVRSDDTLLAAADLIGNGRDQVVIRSENPMHLGVVGFSRSDGAWGTTTSEEYGTARVGGRWGGWRLRQNDLVHGAGRFRTAERDHLLLTGEADSTANAHLGVIGFDEHGAKETVAALPEGSTFGAGGWRYSASDLIAAHGPVVGNGRDQIVLQPAERNAFAIVGLDGGGRWETYAVVRQDDRFGDGWRVNPGDRVAVVAALTDPTRASLVIRSRANLLGVVNVDRDGSTSTGPVLAPGQSFGVDGWTWDTEDVILGVGSFDPSPTPCLVIGRRRGDDVADLGIVTIVDDGFTTVDVTDDKDRVQSLGDLWAIGDFAGRGDDQMLGRRGDHLLLQSLESPAKNDIDFWRESRFAIPMSQPFVSTLRLLEQHINEMADGRSFIEFWRDFTIANVTKHLAHDRSELRYSMSPDRDPAHPETVASLRYPTVPTSTDVARWAARYFELTDAGHWHLTARVADAPHQVFWSIVTADGDGVLTGVHTYRGRHLDAVVMVEQDETATMIVSTTFANVSIEIDPPAIVPPAGPRPRVR